MDETKEQQKPRAEKPEPVKLKFSLPQLIGSALAAATAAFLGSRLGTAGTIIGAALASIVGAVAGTVYTAGLDKTSRHLVPAMRRGWQRMRGKDPSADLEADGHGGLVVEHHPTVTMAPVPAVLDAAEPGTARSIPWPVIWRRVGAVAVAIFGLSLVTITALELVAGRSLGGGPGTTVQQAVQPEPAPSKPSPSNGPTQAPSEDRPSDDHPTIDQPTDSPIPTDSPSPEPTPTSTPTQSPPQTTAPTAPATSAAPPTTPTAPTTTAPTGSPAGITSPSAPAGTPVAR